MTQLIYNTVPGIGKWPWKYAYNRRHGMGFDYNPAEYKLTPRVDIYENDDNFYLEFDLPGMAKEDIKLSVDKNRVLAVEGTKKQLNDSEGVNILRNERRYGEFWRSFELPDSVDSEKISAKFENGVLTLTIPKIAKQEKTVEIM